MKEFKCIQRIFCIESDRIEQAMKDYPDAFHGGTAVVTYNNVYTDNPRICDYDTYCAFFRHFQAMGVDMQVNLSTTIGHADHHRCEAMPFPTMVDADGTGCTVSACPRSEAFKSYLHDTVTRYAVLKPSVFWIDDDFRLFFHAPVDHGCFCEDCIARFNAVYGTAFDRDALHTAIAQDHEADGRKIRALWQEFNRTAMLELVRIIAGAVHAVDDGIIIGYMQVNPELVIYECPHYGDFVELSKNRNGEVWFRHGSGFYTDRDPLGVVAKNISIARLCAMTEAAGDGVVNLVEEVTSPYTRREKSMRITLLEAAMNIGMAGAQGIMDEGIKPNLPEQLLPGRLVATMHESYPLLAQMYRMIEGKRQIGVYPYFSEDLWQYADPVENISRMNDPGSQWWTELFHMGIPFTFRKENAAILLLSSKTVRAMPEEELRGWLKKGIYADGTGAAEINARLGAGFTGVKRAAFDEAKLSGAGISEHFTAHPLNGAEGAGYDRYNIWGMNAHGSACLEADGCEVLSLSMNAAEAEAGIIGTGVYENADGGRIAVAARGPWCTDVLGRFKTQQIKNVMDWLCGKTLPVQVDCTGRMGCSVWESTDGAQRSVFVYNTDFDDACDAVLRTDGEYSASLLMPDGSLRALGTGKSFALPLIPAWSTAVMLLEKI